MLKTPQPLPHHPLHRPKPAIPPLKSNKPQNFKPSLVPLKSKICCNYSSVQDLSGYGTKELNLEGKIVVPGFIDSHMHLIFAGFQEAMVELSEHGVVLIVEDTGCLQAKVYLQRKLFVRYEYNAKGRPRFGVSLGPFVDCLNTISMPRHSSMIEIQYP